MYQVDEHTISLLHFDDGIKDECGRTWVSNNAVTTDSQKVFGASALAVDVEKYIYTDAVSQFDFTGAFTIEMWAILTSYPTAHSGLTTFSLFSQFADVPNNIDFYIGGATATVIGCSYRVNNVSNSPSFGAAYKFNLNTWYHIAFVSDGSKYYIL